MDGTETNTTNGETDAEQTKKQDTPVVDIQDEGDNGGETTSADGDTSSSGADS